MEEMRKSVTGFDIKIDGLDEVVKMLTEAEGRMKILVEMSEGKQGRNVLELRIF
jgi:hypothetical protein